jgi:acetyl-CoA acyltransferase
MNYGGTNEAWIVGAVRTPIGRHGGALANVRPDDLGAVALGALMERTGVPPSEIEDVYFGCANQAGEDNRNVARMSLLLASFPEQVAGVTVNRLCGSGLEAIAQSARAVMLGEADVYVGGGVESMSRAPWAVPKPERAFPTGNTTIYDTTLGWRFVNPRMEEMGHTDSLGMTAENLARERYLLTPDEDEPDEVAAAYDVSREAQDRFALRSHEKALAAIDEKRFREELVPATVKTRKGETLVEADEGPRRDTSLNVGRVRAWGRSDEPAHRILACMEHVGSIFDADSAEPLAPGPELGPSRRRHLRLLGRERLDLGKLFDGRSPDRLPPAGEPDRLDLLRAGPRRRDTPLLR